jgi:Kef-type K+ transport system membrane component KefB
MNIYYEAAIWIGMAMLASVLSIRIAVAVALVEIVVGAVAGNLPGLKQHVTGTDIVTFLAGVGLILLTFLAGAEIDPVSLKRDWKASLCIGEIVAGHSRDHDPRRRAERSRDATRGWPSDPQARRVISFAR